MDISFVIPCYCSEKNLEGVISEIEAAMKKREGFEYEIILVNDNSKDNTKGLINRLSKENGRIIGINFAKNFGQPNALLAGFNQASGKYIMTSDDDGQTPFNELDKLFQKIEEGYDLVEAKYAVREKRSLFRKLGTVLNESMATWLIGTKVNEFMLYHMIDKPKEIGLSSFFMAKRFVVKEMVKYQNPYPYIAGLLLRTSGKIGNVHLKQRERATGKSGYNFKKLLKLWINGFTAFSIKPLRVGSALGFISSVCGVLLGIISLIRKLIIPTIQVGYTSQMAVTLFLGGLILGVLGIIGEYTGRIYMCINNQPQYVIESIVKDGEDLL